MSSIAVVLVEFETSTFLFQDDIQYAHPFESSTQPFFSVCSNSATKVSNILDTALLFATFLIPKDKKGTECRHC